MCVYTTFQVQVTKSADGLTVVTCNNGSPLTAIGVLVKAGSRYETYDTLGTSNAFKNSIGLSTKSHSSFGINRNVQQMGTNIAVNNAREYMSFRYVLKSICKYLFFQIEIHYIVSLRPNATSV